MKRYALLSLTDKTQCEDLARALESEGLHLLASGGTKDYLRSHGFEVTDIADFTGEAERFGGRVKTLHHKVYASLLLRADNPKDLSEWPESLQIAAVACNFYPFESKAPDSKDWKELVEWVDIGGPTMVRAAAKNFHHVWIFTRPDQYSEFIQRSSQERQDLSYRARLSLEAFELVQKLDTAIVNEWTRRLSFEKAKGDTASDALDAIRFETHPSLQYGENPHQAARFFPASRRVLFSGKVSYNNVRDAEAAWKFVREFESSSHPAVAVVKHQTLCGAAVALKSQNFEKAFHWAWEADPVSRFGGILGFNRVPDAAVTERLLKPFIEVLVLPLSEESQEWTRKFRAQRPRVLVVLVENKELREMESWSGSLGHLLQEPDTLLASKEVFKAQNSSDFLKEVSTWMGACSKSNAIVLTAQDGDGTCFLLGAGQGQPNRIEAFKQLAWPRAKEFMERFPEIQSSQLLTFSDAFLPFPDLVEEMARVGLKRLVQPGGSKNDELVLNRAQELGIKVEVTGRRHFWH